MFDYLCSLIDKQWFITVFEDQLHGSYKHKAEICPGQIYFINPIVSYTVCVTFQVFNQCICDILWWIAVVVIVTTLRTCVTEKVFV